MEKCELCGRQPAKRMTFKSHQGLLVVRITKTISAVLCRDHALEAYAHSRGETLRGMWFSPGSLVFGTLRSLWDSAKLLDLPDEVKDSPWVHHKVACPRCGTAHFTLAGPVECTKCAHSFVVCSCVKCCSVHVATVPARSNADDAKLHCRNCGAISPPPGSVRNWPLLLIAQALAETAAEMSQADPQNTDHYVESLRQTVRRIHGFKPNTVAWLCTYFNSCIDGQHAKLLDACSALEGSAGIHHLVLSFAVELARGATPGPGILASLRHIASRLGLDPLRVFPSDGDYRCDSGPWWEVLGVQKESAPAEVDAAYRRLAKKYHPDLASHLEPDERRAAEQRMRNLNVAYALGKRAAHPSATGGGCTETPHRPPQSNRQETTAASAPSSPSARTQREARPADTRHNALVCLRTSGETQPETADSPSTSPTVRQRRQPVDSPNLRAAQPHTATAMRDGRDGSASRLLNLEQSNRRLRWAVWGLGCFGSALVICFLMATLPGAPPSLPTPKSATYGGFKEWDGNGLKMKFSWCPPGHFATGSPVTITHGFWLGKHETTQGEWKHLMDSEPWAGGKYVKAGRDYAASHLSWEDATKFCEELTKKERSAGRLPQGWVYALPTEAQWEYACRAGSRTRFGFGDDDFADLSQYAWYDKNALDVGDEYAHRVGRRRANDWGLHDMHGNVWEWCRDWYKKALPGGADPEQTERTPYRVIRGGSWDGSAWCCGSAHRSGYATSYRGSALGFRVALVQSR